MTADQMVREVLVGGPLLTTDLYERVTARGVSRNSARVAVNRMLERRVLHTTPLTFRKNSQLVSLRPLDDGPQALVYLYENGFFGRTGVFDLFETLRLAQPVLDAPQVVKLLNAPARDGTKLDTAFAEEALQLLVDIGAATRTMISPDDPVWVLDKPRLQRASIGTTSAAPDISSWRMKEKFRRALAEQVRTYLFQNGFCSERGTRVVDESSPVVTYATRAFDVLGFSHARGIARWRKENYVPVPFLADVNLERCHGPAARSMIARLDDARSSSPLQPEPVGIVVAKNFDEQAFDVLKKRGVLPWRHDQLMGKQTASALAAALTSTDQLIRQQRLDPKLFEQVLDGAANFGSLFGNLKGQLFELLVAHLYATRGYTIRLSWRVKETATQEFDVDVLATLPNEALVIECKGYAAGKVVPPEEVRRHFERRGPAARHALRNNPILKNPRYRYVFVTTGDFDPESVQHGTSWIINGDTTGQLIDRSQLVAELRDSGNEELLALVDRYLT